MSRYIHKFMIDIDFYSSCRQWTSISIAIYSRVSVRHLETAMSMYKKFDHCPEENKPRRDQLGTI